VVKFDVSWKGTFQLKAPLNSVPGCGTSTPAIRDAPVTCAVHVPVPLAPAEVTADCVLVALTLPWNWIEGTSSDGTRVVLPTLKAGVTFNPTVVVIDASVWTPKTVAVPAQLVAVPVHGTLSGSAPATAPGASTAIAVEFPVTESALAPDGIDAIAAQPARKAEVVEIVS